MVCAKLAAIMLLSYCLLCHADEIAFGDVDENGKLQNRVLTQLDVARGVHGLFLSDPMEAIDYTHVSVVRNSLLAQLKATASNSKRLASLEEALAPIFKAMPKDSQGRLTSGTANYALHRLFSEHQGWSIKGLQPAGAAWMADMSVSEGVKDISKYMVPTYLQMLLQEQLGVSSFDIRSLAILAATLEHLINAELTNMVYSVYTTLELPVPGKRTEQQVNDILDTFMMVYAFGVNLDVSNLGDVTRTKIHLNVSHPGWPQLQAFAQKVKRSIFTTGELDFDDIVRVVKRIGEKYVGWQGRDCTRVKDELARKPSYSKGAVRLSEISPLLAKGRRTLLTESVDELRGLGALHESSYTEAQLIIPNYINSQGMCLPTASFYAACCVNECEQLLAKLEREARGPLARPEDLMRSMSWQPISETMAQELHSLKDRAGLVPIHSRGFAQWMHKAFPLQCPAPKPNATHFEKVANPKTPDEWMNTQNLEVMELAEMMVQGARSLGRYTTLGTEATGPTALSLDPVSVSDSGFDVVRIRSTKQKRSQRGLVPSAMELSAIASLITVSVAFIRSGLAGIRCWQQKGKKGMQDMSWKDIA